MPPTPSTPNAHIIATTLRSLKRVDPGISRIVAQAAYVVAYLAGSGPNANANANANAWDKMGVEGSLFVYER